MLRGQSGHSGAERAQAPRRGSASRPSSAERRGLHTAPELADVQAAKQARAGQRPSHMAATVSCQDKAAQPSCNQVPANSGQTSRAAPSSTLSQAVRQAPQQCAQPDRAASQDMAAQLAKAAAPTGTAIQGRSQVGLGVLAHASSTGPSKANTASQRAAVPGSQGKRSANQQQAAAPGQTPASGTLPDAPAASVQAHAAMTNVEGKQFDSILKRNAAAEPRNRSTRLQEQAACGTVCLHTNGTSIAGA